MTSMRWLTASIRPRPLYNDGMNPTHCCRLCLCTVVALILASCLTAGQPGLGSPQTVKPAASKPAGRSSQAGSAALQSLRNIGKAYYEQGKYIEAIAEFNFRF